MQLCDLKSHPTASEGAWFDVEVQTLRPMGKPNGHACIRIAAIGTSAYRSARHAAILAGHRDHDIVALVNGCVRDWAGLTEDGAPVPFSHDRLLDIVRAADGFQTLQFITQCANHLANLSRDQLEQALGN